MALKNADNPEFQNQSAPVIKFSVKSMVEYYESMDNIMYIERENPHNNNKNANNSGKKSVDK